MNITIEETVKILAEAIAYNLNLRAVLECENNETMLIDFSACGEPYDDDTVCVWSLQRSIYTAEEGYCGTDEIDAGTFQHYLDVFTFVQKYAQEHGKELYVESF